MADAQIAGTILLAGASRGLGLGLARLYLERGWQVVATARSPNTATGLSELHGAYPNTLSIETLDVTDPQSRAALAARLEGRRLDVLFVVAGALTSWSAAIHDMPPEAIAAEFATNAVAPIAVAEAFHGLMKPQATIAFMTSILGSIASNRTGGLDLYRASKAALNMLGVCFAFRHPENPVLLLHPGWVRTDMGGAGADIDVATSVTGLAEVIAARSGQKGVAYLDYLGRILPW
jgi:NAD(P)-dependent dehydrogenase (short-subunit alcohol dehydrogenase family)